MRVLITLLVILFTSCTRETVPCDEECPDRGYIYVNYALIKATDKVVGLEIVFLCNGHYRTRLDGLEIMNGGSSDKYWFFGLCPQSKWKKIARRFTLSKSLQQR